MEVSKIMLIFGPASKEVSQLYGASIAGRFSPRCLFILNFSLTLSPTLSLFTHVFTQRFSSCQNKKYFVVLPAELKTSFMDVSILQHAKDKAPRQMALDEVVELIRGDAWPAGYQPLAVMASVVSGGVMRKQQPPKT